MGGSSKDIYKQSINKVIDYIEKNINKKLTLEELAEVAGFSKYYFHRIFSSYMGETLNNFVMRVRIEKVAMMICNKPHKTLTELAYQGGFSDSAAFSKAFKKRFDLPAYEWSKKSYLLSNSEQDRGVTDSNLKNDEISSIFVAAQLEVLPKTTLAYVRYFGRYAGDEELFYSLYQRLQKWAEVAGVDFNLAKKICLYHDSLYLTDENKLRVTAGIEISSDTEVSGDVGKLTIDKGKYLVAKYQLNKNQYQLAWDHVFGYLLNYYQVRPSSEPSFEMYNNNYENDNYNVSICVPII